jgi:hypothetical protein
MKDRWPGRRGRPGPGRSLADHGARVPEVLPAATFDLCGVDSLDSCPPYRNLGFLQRFHARSQKDLSFRNTGLALCWRGYALLELVKIPLDVLILLINSVHVLLDLLALLLVLVLGLL